jgi:hypothetical protein
VQQPQRTPQQPLLLPQQQRRLPPTPLLLAGVRLGGPLAAVAAYMQQLPYRGWLHQKLLMLSSLVWGLQVCHTRQQLAS